MGFREYNPGLNRFLSRDMFDGAPQDLGLGTDPWNANRYMFGGGNPSGRVELDGHMNAITDDDGNGGMTPTPHNSARRTPVTESRPTEPSTVGKVSRWFAPAQFGKNVTDEVVVKPVQETYEACKAAVQMRNYQANWQTCKTGSSADRARLHRRRQGPRNRRQNRRRTRRRQSRDRDGALPCRKSVHVC